MPKKATKGKLKPKEETAVCEYLKNGCHQRKACEIAFPHIMKWKSSTRDEFACRLFAKPDVKARLSAVERKAAKKTEITAEWIIGTLVTNINRCMQAEQVLDASGEPVMIDTPDGKVAAAFQYKPEAVNSGIEKMMRHKGLFELDNRQRDSMTRAIGKLPLERLEDIADKLEKLREK